MTQKQKIDAVAASPELLTAISMLIITFKDCEPKSHLRLTYEAPDKKMYELTFLPLFNNHETK